MKYIAILAGCFAGFALAAPPAQPLGCLIEPHLTSDVGSPVVGVIEALHVDRGDRVSRGQPLATLKADVERASLQVAQGRAEATGELRAAEANFELARQKLARAEDLASGQYISTQALEQARAEYHVAQNRLAQAREQRGIYAREYELARAQLAMRTIRSPASGVVADRFLSAGERVEEKPVFRIAVVDPLRVEVVLPAHLFSSVRTGTTMTVHPEFPGALPRKARVSVVDRVVEGASNTFRARLDLPNPDRALPPGLRCKAEISPADLLPTSAGRPGAARPAAAPSPARSAPGEMRLRLAPALQMPSTTRP